MLDTRLEVDVYEALRRKLYEEKRQRGVLLSKEDITHGVLEENLRNGAKVKHALAIDEDTFYFILEETI